MSDIVLGALIGFGAAAVSAIMTGIISYRISKLQTDARDGEINRQLNHQQREARLDRLVEARKGYLIDLRSTTSEWEACSNRQVNMIVRLKKAYEEYDEGSPSRQLEVMEFNEVSTQCRHLSTQFEILRRQVNDKKLAQLIEALTKTQYEVNTSRLPLIRFFNNPGGADTDTLECAFQRDEALRNRVWDQVLQVNRRIEELLSGEPST